MACGAQVYDREYRFVYLTETFASAAVIWWYVDD